MAKLLSGYNKKQGTLKLLKESVEPSDSKDVYLTGIFQVFDEENENGRIYPESVLRPEVERYVQEFVKTNRAFGELDHPEERATIAGDRVCHRVVDLWIEGKNVMGKTLILDTTLGKEVKAMLKNGGVLGVSSRSLGETDNYNRVKDLYLICWDVVQEPSVSVALMEKLNEAREFDIQLFKKFDKKVKKLKEYKNINKDDLEREQREILFSLRKFLIERCER